MVVNQRVVDPVCGMEIDVESSILKSIYNGTVYYLCSASCLKQFEENPEKYITVAETNNNNTQKDEDSESRGHHSEGNHCCCGHKHKDEHQHNDHCCHK